MKKKLCALFLSFALLFSLLPVSVMAAGEITEGTHGDNLQWHYDTASATLTITGSGNFVAPDEAGYPWEIYRKEVQSLIIGEGILSIPYDGFVGYIRLKNLSLPDSLTTIDRYAFRLCTSLEEVVLPKGLSELNLYAFSECTALKRYVVSSENPNFSADSRGVLFNKDKTELVRCPLAFSGGYDIPASVKTLGVEAFRDCSNLAVVSVPEGVTALPFAAFWNCIRLKWIDLPTSLESLGYGAFLGCKSLVQIVLPEKVKSIDWSCFSGCDYLVNIVLPESLEYIGVSAFNSQLNAEDSPRHVTYQGSREQWEQINNESGDGLNLGVFHFDASADTVDWNVESGHLYCKLCEKYVGVTFEDVPEAAYYWAPVSWASARNVTTGTTETTFSPEESCTRGQIVTLLWRAYGSPKALDSTNNPFVDVSPDAYYYEAVLWAVGKGITNGITETEFCPEEPCTRGQVVTFLWRANGKPVNDYIVNSFGDVPEDAYFTDAVLWAIDDGITNGTAQGVFSPDQICTRGQIVTFLFFAMS